MDVLAIFILSSFDCCQYCLQFSKILSWVLLFKVSGSSASDSLLCWITVWIHITRSGWRFNTSVSTSTANYLEFSILNIRLLICMSILYCNPIIEGNHQMHWARKISWLPLPKDIIFSNVYTIISLSFWTVIVIRIIPTKGAGLLLQKANRFYVDIIIGIGIMKTQ